MKLIIAHTVNMGYGRYGCGFCDFISNDLVNTYTHVGYLHLAPQCERCHSVCFQSCYGIEEADTPTSTESPPILLSSFTHFLGEFTPKTAIEPDLDYIVKTTNWGVEGLWLCIICGSTNRDFGVMNFHVRFDHAEVKCRFCDMYFACFFSMDAHYQEARAHLIPIECQLCKVMLPNSAAMEPHQE